MGTGVNFLEIMKNIFPVGWRTIIFVPFWKFPNRWIETEFVILWPHRFPDFTPLEILKTLIFLKMCKI